MQKRINIILGIVLSITAIILLNYYIAEERKKMKEELNKKFAESYNNLKQLTPAVFAKKNIPAGTRIVPSLIGTRIIPRSELPSEGVTDSGAVLGYTTLAPIKEGEYLNYKALKRPPTSKFSSRKSRRTLADLTPAGKRAITIKVDNTMGLGGMVKPGDYVDIVALLPAPAKTPEGKQVKQVVSIPIFQNVLVLATGGSIGEKEVKREEGKGLTKIFKQRERKETKTKKVDNSIVTVALAPKEASLLSFLSEQTKLRLLLRSPIDAKVQPIPPASWEAVFQYVNSMFPEMVKKIQESAEKQRQVDIYRGLKKEYIAVSKE